MRQTFVLLTFLGLCTSCASIFNHAVMESTVYTEKPAKIIIGNDTISSRKSETVVHLKRNKQPIDITAVTETESKKVTVKSKNSFAYINNIFLCLGIGYFAERNNPKRYSYPKEIYILDSIPLKRSSPWAVSVAASYITMKLSDAYEPEQNFKALSLAVSFDITKELTGRITYSRSDHSHDEFQVTTYGGTSVNNPVVNVDDQWWITDTRFELLFRPEKLSYNGAGLYFTSGLAIRNSWHKNILDPEPEQPFGYDSERPDGGYFYLDDESNKTMFYETYLTILGGLGYNVRTGPIQLFAEPTLEVSSVPAMWGGESLSARGRISFGLTYHFGDKSKKLH
jgi:hypothetical protein